MSPYQLVYGHEAVLPWEIRLGSRRVTFQDQLTAEDYATLMKDELEDLVGHRLNALINIEANKVRVGRWYDKKVKAKSFDQGNGVDAGLADRNERPQIRQMVSKVGRAIQG